jgi:hypothetical protein
MKKKIGPNTVVVAFWGEVEIAFKLVDCERCTSGFAVKYAKKIDDDRPEIVPAVIRLSEIRKTSIPKNKIEDFTRQHGFAA